MYVPCLVDLCGLLWRLVCNYRHSTQWHADHDNEEHFFERGGCNGVALVVLWIVGWDGGVIVDNVEV